MTGLLIVRRISSGRAWTGKTIDCLLLNDHGTHREGTSSGGNLNMMNMKNDEPILTSMGFNPNTELSSITQGASHSERENEMDGGTSRGRHGNHRNVDV